MQEKNASVPFDKFELCAAILLGLGAIGAAVASHQSGLWAGQSVEGYGESAALTTKASTTYNDELTSYIQDSQVDVRAKELIWEALEIDDEARAARLKHMAGWLYISQLSDEAYEALKLPKQEESEANGGDPDAIGADASEVATKADDSEEEVFSFSDDELLQALNIDLSEEYVSALFAPSVEEFEAAEKRFAEARLANEIGDKFSLAGVILTVALFFGGLALVFKTSIRWGFLGTGALILTAGAGFMNTLTWA